MFSLREAMRATQKLLQYPDTAPKMLIIEKVNMPGNVRNPVLDESFVYSRTDEVLAKDCRALRYNNTENLFTGLLKKLNIDYYKRPRSPYKVIGFNIKSHTDLPNGIEGSVDDSALVIRVIKAEQ